MQRFFKDRAMHVSMIARGKAHKVAKAGGKDKDPEEEAAGGAEKVRKDLSQSLEDVATDAAREGLDGIVNDAQLDAILHQANPDAVEWARERAAELVTSLDETTQEDVRAIVARAEAEGWSNDELADALLNAAAFSDERADTIARTETAMADVAGSVIGWKASGVVSGKQFIVAQDEVCDECQPFDGQVVGIDEDFPEGDPPIHPNCRCDVIPVLAAEDEEEGS